MTGRLLHYVYKVPKRTDTVDFYRSLGMQALRHEEFTGIGILSFFYFLDLNRVRKANGAELNRFPGMYEIVWAYSINWYPKLDFHLAMYTPLSFI